MIALVKANTRFAPYDHPDYGEYKLWRIQDSPLHLLNEIFSRALNLK